MRRASRQANAITAYLGRLAGAGSMTVGAETVARVSFEFDGFATRDGGVTGSGELKLLTPFDLEAVFGGPKVQILTDGGRLLDLRFSEESLSAGTEAVHVDVSGDLPHSSSEWRAAPTPQPTNDAASD